jgi:hypothetical protein
VGFAAEAEAHVLDQITGQEAKDAQTAELLDVNELVLEDVSGLRRGCGKRGGDGAREKDPPPEDEGLRADELGDCPRERTGVKPDASLRAPHEPASDLRRFAICLSSIE